MLSLLALYVSTAAAVSSNALVNVALPTIANDLGLTPADSTWVINAYQLGLITSLIPLSAAGEIFGIRRVYIGGLMLLALAGLGASMAANLPMLCLFRAAQGLGSAAILALNGALVRRIYPPDALGRGISYNAILIAIVGAASPSLAGAVLSVSAWSSLFLIMAAVAAVALVAGWKVLPSERNPGVRLSLLDTGLNAVAFGALFLALSNAGHQNVSADFVIQLVIGLGAGWLLVRRARRSARPFLPVDLLVMPRLRLSYSTSFCCFTAQSMALVALPFFIHSRLGFSPLQTGSMMSVWPVSLAGAAFLAGRLVERQSPLRVATVGLGLFAAGLAVIPAGIVLAGSTSPALSGLEVSCMVVGLVFCGSGFGLFQTPNNRTMLATAPPERIGPAAGMIAQVRLVGQATGVTLAGAVFGLFGAQSTIPFVLGALLTVFAAGLNAQRLRMKAGLLAKA